MPKLIDLLGMRFSRLLVVGRKSRNKRGELMWDCACDCGNTCFTTGTKLRTGHTKSCGCLNIESLIRRSVIHFATINRRSNPEFRSWLSAKDRCFNPNCTCFANYGARGITMCDEWIHSFENFLRHIGKCPPGYMLDRINNDGNYEPGNVRWASRKTQNNNTRSNRWIKIDGVSRTVSQWENELGIKRGVIASRLSRGKSDVQAVTTPIRRKKITA